MTYDRQKTIAFVLYLPSADKGFKPDFRLAKTKTKIECPHARIEKFLLCEQTALA